MAHHRAFLPAFLLSSLLSCCIPVLLSASPAPRIAVVGSLNMDLVVRAPRFASPGETITGDAFLTVAGGKGANQAIAARRLGADVVMIGRVGDDAFGTTLRQGLMDEGVDVRQVTVTSATATGVALITVDERGENTIIVVPGANGRCVAADIDDAWPLVQGADVLMLQLEVPLPVVTRAVTCARDAGVTVMLNAAPARPLDASLLSSIDYLIVNRTEAAVIAGLPLTAAPEDAARAVQACGARTVVMTLGAAGALSVGPGDDASAVPAFDVTAVDTTAAGDAFAGAFAVAVAERAATIEALRMGTAAGALAVMRAGAQPSLPTRADVQALRASRS
jgi:ribokinase